jgi:hypothetical protein
LPDPVPPVSLSGHTPEGHLEQFAMKPLQARACSRTPPFRINNLASNPAPEEEIPIFREHKKIPGYL